MKAASPKCQPRLLLLQALAVFLEAKPDSVLAAGGLQEVSKIAAC